MQTSTSCPVPFRDFPCDPPAQANFNTGGVTDEFSDVYMIEASDPLCARLLVLPPVPSRLYHDHPCENKS